MKLPWRSARASAFSQPVRVGVLSVGYVDDRRDDPVDSRRGTYNSLDLGVCPAFASETDYFVCWA
jgi:hypothetical protein